MIGLPGLRTALVAAAAMVALLGPGTAPASAETFAGQNFGVTLSYPDSWLNSLPEPFTLILGPADPALAGLVTVAVQNVTRPESEPADTSAKIMAADYLKQMKTMAQNLKVVSQVNFIWPGVQAPTGQQVVSDFDQGGLPLRQWAVFQRSPFGPVVHIWLYTAPQSTFDDWLPDARKVLDSLQPEKPRPGRP